MSLTVQQLIIDAKKLAEKLKDDETKADNMITQAKSTHNHIEAMKQYSDDVEKLNEAASQRPHSVLVAGLKRESQHMRELRAENRELRIALAEYQNSVKLIMTKYRQQISHLINGSKVDISSLHNSHCSHYSQVILEQYAKMDKMRKVMTKAINVVEENATDKELKVEELISRLMTENKGLREIINIYTKYGCQQPTLEGKEEGKEKEMAVEEEKEKDEQEEEKTSKEEKAEMEAEDEILIKKEPELKKNNQKEMEIKNEDIATDDHLLEIKQRQPQN